MKTEEWIEREVDKLTDTFPAEWTGERYYLYIETGGRAYETDPEPLKRVEFVYRNWRAGKGTIKLNLSDEVVILYPEDIVNMRIMKA